MPTFVVVDKDTDPLGPNEVRAGETIDVSNGDIYVISASAANNVKFKSATGNPTNFEIRFETSNSNNFDIDIGEDLDAGIVISNDVDLSDVDIDADKSLSVILTAGDNVSLGKFEGSKDGVDALTIGNGFTTDHDIKLHGGDNFLTIGDNATIRKIDADDGADTIIIGDGLIADDIKTGKGGDAITIGDDATLDKIETGDGDDTLSFGDNLFADDIKTGKGADALGIGDDGVLDKIDTGDGNDTVSVGDGFTADKLETKDGNDRVISGAQGSIDDLDGGKGNDTLSSDTDYPNASSFETICFASGTRIETDTGRVPIDALCVGDRILTMDNGFQTIRWISSTSVAGQGLHSPVRIAAGALGNSRPLWVSQQHRMLFSGAQVELYFGEPEVLVAAKHLAGLPGIELVDLPQIEYFHMLFDRHEIVFAEGIPSESFYPGALGMNTLSAAACAEIYSLFPELESGPVSFGDAARYVLRSFEARLLAA